MKDITRSSLHINWEFCNNWEHPPFILPKVMYSPILVYPSIQCSTHVRTFESSVLNNCLGWSPATSLHGVMRGYMQGYTLSAKMYTPGGK